MKKFIGYGLVVAVMAGLGLWIAMPTINQDNCIHVYVEFGALDNNKKSEKCVNSSQAMNALDVMNYAGIDISGTKKYGNQIVCRLDNMPSATKPIGLKGHEDYIESCTDMPAEFAYWGVFVKPYKKANVPLDFHTGWNWAETGIDKVTLNPGDSIGLVFQANEKVSLPQE
jgi:hypothetical protein